MMFKSMILVAMFASAFGAEMMAGGSRTDEKALPVLAEQWQCQNSDILAYVRSSVKAYTGTNNAGGLSNMIATYVLSRYPGSWVITATQLINQGTTKSQWAYNGSPNVQYSQNWCLYVSDTFEVQVVKVQI